MKKLFFAIFIILPILLSAKTQYLFDIDGKTSGGLGGTNISILNANGKQTTANGGFGGWIIDDTFYIGGYGIKSGTQDDISIGHGGLTLGYNINSKKAFHPFIFTTIGTGSISKSGQDSNENNKNSDEKITSLGLNIGLQLNITNWLRLTPHIGYSYVVFYDTSNIYNENDFSGLVYGLNFEFGYWGK